jgi:hypothetical protein
MVGLGLELAGGGALCCLLAGESAICVVEASRGAQQRG